MKLSNLELAIIQAALEYLASEDKVNPISLNEEGIKKLAEISVKISKNTFKSDLDAECIKPFVTDRFLKNINYSK